jgi:hypothetical protein
MAFNTDPHREPRRINRSDAAIWVIALVAVGLVGLLIFTTSTNVPDATGPAGVTETSPEATPAPRP